VIDWSNDAENSAWIRFVSSDFGDNLLSLLVFGEECCSRIN